MHNYFLYGILNFHLSTIVIHTLYINNHQLIRHCYLNFLVDCITREKTQSLEYKMYYVFIFEKMRLTSVRTQTDNRITSIINEYRDSMKRKSTLKR